MAIATQQASNKLKHAMLLNDCPSLVTLVSSRLSVDRHHAHPDGSHEKRMPATLVEAISIQSCGGVLEPAPPLLFTLQILIEELNRFR
jgi:hypothetical protein